MQWIKRNLFLVVGGLVALGLLGFASFYLYKKIQLSNSVTAELETATSRLTALATRDPHPGTDKVDNIGAAKNESERLGGFLAELTKFFIPPPYPTEIDDKAFRMQLEKTRAYLNDRAERAGVEVPTNYWFTFEAQKGQMTFTAGTLEPLASQLADIRAICEVLFDAKVNRLVGMKRVKIDSQDTLGSQDYLDAKASTNTWAITTPYQVTFQGFSSQLASVLDGFLALPHCVIVTNIVVFPAGQAPLPTEDQSTWTGPTMAGGMDTSLLRRYGLMGRYGRYGAASAPMAPQPVVQRPASDVVLDEKALQCTLSLQVVKLKPQPPSR